MNAGLLNRLRLRLLDRVDAVDVWRVDGHRVRDRLDVEFTNGHHHFTRAYIPEDEIWLDREAPGGSEWRLWALRQRVERRVMAGGAGYLRALRLGRHEERNARKADPDRSAAAADVRRRRLGAVQGRDVWLVDGRRVRDHAFIDFTLGGHGHRYRFIPKHEIWIDDAVAPAERGAILCHEACEVGLMAAGMGYDAAHARSSLAEARFRRAHAGRAR